MTSPYLGQIMMFAGTFAPKGWAFCNGQLLSIQQNTALFSLIGTYYGGNGVNNFGLPNLQSLVPIHQGQGPGLSPYAIGQVGGSPAVTLTAQSVPSHMHTFTVSTADATTNTISSTVTLAKQVGTTGTPQSFANLGSPPTQLTLEQMAPQVLPQAGQSLPHTNLMPSLCVTFVIALSGVFPSRN